MKLFDDWLSRTLGFEFTLFNWTEDYLPRFIPKVIFPKGREHEGDEFKMFEVKLGWRKFQIGFVVRYYEIP